MTVREMTFILESAVSVAGLITWWFWLQSDYACDSFRQKEFALRDEMFDFAASGAIAFNDPAYAELRLLMNRVIRFGHRITFWRVVQMLFLDNIGERVQNAGSFFLEWEKSFKNIPDPAVKTRLNVFRVELALLIVRRIKNDSVFAFLLWSSIVLWVRVFQAKTSASATLERFFRPERIEERAWESAG